MELIPLFTLLAPLALLPVEIIFPYPYIAEELTKAIFVFVAKNYSPTKKTYFSVFALSGFTFALSETFLYSINLNSFGQINYLLFRLLFTGLLHTTTFLILAASAWKKRAFLLIGLIISIAIHYIYNLNVPNLLTLLK